MCLLVKVIVLVTGMIKNMHILEAPIIHLSTQFSRWDFPGQVLFLKKMSSENEA